MTENMREDESVVQATRRWMRRGVVIFILLAVAFPIYRGVEQSRRPAEMKAQLHALITSGGQLYSLNCTSCHGTTGQGGSAPALNSQEFLTSTTDEQMAGIIRGGVPGTEMPAWWNEYGGPLTDQQIQELVTYIRSWEKTAPSVPNWRTPSGGP
jgi:mono/diheme cytochrome c family protein